MKSLEETDVPKNEPGNSADSSFVNILARSNAFKKSFFPTDREVFVDSNYPLILLNDTNTFLPFRHNIISPPSERKDLSNQTLLENEYHPHDKKEIFRRQKTFRQISNIISNSRNSSQSDVNIKAESEKMCSKSITVQEYSEKEENEVDIFQVEDKTLLMINARKAWLRGILDSKYWNIVIAVCILYALFAQDICVAFFTRKADLGFDVVSLMTIITFSIEILLTSYAKKEYIGSFFMVLDVISTLSIFLDIDFLTGSLFSNG